MESVEKWRGPLFRSVQGGVNIPAIRPVLWFLGFFRFGAAGAAGTEHRPPRLGDPGGGGDRHRERREHRGRAALHQGLDEGLAQGASDDLAATQVLQFSG